MSRTFIFVLINTAFITLAVNADLGENFFLRMPGYIFDGSYEDFTRDWYIDVGRTFTATMFL